MGDQKNTTYLLWCSPKGESISWVDPVCVEQCPTKDHLPTVMCPLPKVKREQEIPEENGTIRIVQTVEQSLSLGNLPYEELPFLLLTGSRK